MSGIITDYFTTGSGAPSGSPSVPSGELAFYYRTSNSSLYCWTGSAWVDVSGGGGGAAIATAKAQGSGSADYTTTSAVFVDIDATDLAPTIAAVAGDVLEIMFFGTAQNGAAANYGITLDVGGTVLGDAFGLVFDATLNQAPFCLSVQHTVLSGEISGGTVLVKPQYATSSGTLALYNRSAVVRPYLTIKNLLH